MAVTLNPRRPRAIALEVGWSSFASMLRTSRGCGGLGPARVGMGVSTMRSSLGSHFVGGAHSFELG